MEPLNRKNGEGVNIFVLSSSLYVSFQLFANILSTKIALLPIIHMSIDGGTVIYPLTFTLRDFVHKTHGKKDARQVIIIAAALNAVMFGLFWLVGKMTPDPTWQFQTAYQQILLPVGRIVLASIIAQVISELMDTEIFSFVYKKTTDTLAVLASNSISLVVDSVVFCLIAFFGALPFSTVLAIIFTNILVKFIISTLSVPTIKLIPRTAKFEEI
ncbi:MAG: queuosine precursor transporter [Candidatus Moranbacteria bacterium]|nr:queuosine precursor transporter [Candidatus Moranbacteria bacterium]